MSVAMRRLLSTALILSLTACASTPTPAVQTAPPAPVTTEPPTTTSVEATDAGAPTAATTPEAAADAGSPEATTTPATTTPATTTPAATTPTTTTPATTPPAGGGTVAQGRAVFQRVCARCHEDGEPDGPVPNLRWSEARMREMVRNGNRRMRAIPTTRLSDADLATLVVYLRSTHAIQ